MRIFVAPGQLAAGALAIRGDEHHYLAIVRRARIGDAVELVDGAGHHAAAIITAITSDATTLDVGAPALIVARPPHIRALVPLIKGDRMDTCLEKLVEVGVDEIIVWSAARSVVKLEPDRKHARLAKYQAQVQAAARQSGRAQVPGLRIADALRDVLPTTGLRLVLDPTSDAPLTAGDATEVTIASGPEGGLTADEHAVLAHAGFTGIGLGPRILRAETAPVITVAVIRSQTNS